MSPAAPVLVVLRAPRRTPPELATARRRRSTSPTGPWLVCAPRAERWPDASARSSRRSSRSSSGTTPSGWRPKRRRRTIAPEPYSGRRALAPGRLGAQRRRGDRRSPSPDERLGCARPGQLRNGSARVQSRRPRERGVFAGGGGSAAERAPPALSRDSRAPSASIELPSSRNASPDPSTRGRKESRRCPKWRSAAHTSAR